MLHIQNWLLYSGK